MASKDKLAVDLLPQPGDYVHFDSRDGEPLVGEVFLSLGHVNLIIAGAEPAHLRTDNQLRVLYRRWQDFLRPPARR